MSFFTHNVNTFITAIDFVEKHPVLANAFFAILSAVGGVFIFELWKKRQNAKCDFYVKLSLELSDLRQLLEQTRQLQLTDPSRGNIFSLTYGPRIREYCPNDYHKPSKNELNSLGDIADRIMVILSKSDNIVHPSGLTRGEWIEDLHILSSFCRFLNDAKHDTIIYMNHNTHDNEQPLHIEKCTQLVEAMNEIQESINH